VPIKSTRTVRKPSATRGERAQVQSGSPATLSKAHVQGFIAGCASALLATFGAEHWWNDAEEALPAAVPSALNVQVESGPRFDFYQVLPNQELDLSPEIEPADLRAASQSNTEYLLQVGSFRQESDADRRRGELALLGLEASIEAGDGDNGRWYRVYLGPFTNRSEMARARTLTAQADMDTLLLKRQLAGSGATP
jgi:cell division protein FtsN